jgi:hypothetical protein
MPKVKWTVDLTCVGLCGPDDSMSKFYYSNLLKERDPQNTWSSEHTKIIWYKFKRMLMNAPFSSP